MRAIALPGQTHAHSMSSVRISAPLLAEPDSDGMLVLRAAAGDARAFDDIVRRHTALLRATASRILRSSSDVDDAVQDTFIAAWRHLDTLTDGSTIAGWLLTTVRRQCYSQLRSAAQRHRSDFDGDVAVEVRARPRFRVRALRTGHRGTRGTGPDAGAAASLLGAAPAARGQLP
ncbi:RNA polymerase sigma factor [Microbacterium sp. 1P10UB]|uniref:RNA polymerase sigma factor n=1 Tax=unclassified Microbacterium TaxID=2609290 RepID=UPI0039A2FE18